MHIKSFKSKISAIFLLITSAHFALFLIPIICLPLLPIKRESIRKFIRHFVNAIQLVFLGLVCALLELFLQIRIVVTGGSEMLSLNYYERSILICNHKSRIDWLFLFCLALRMRKLSLLKICLKRSLSSIPIIGWGMSWFIFAFMKRNDREGDLSTIRNVLEYHVAFSEEVFFVIFPEGTDLGENSWRRHVEFLNESIGVNNKDSIGVTSNDSIGVTNKDSFYKGHVLYPKQAGFIEAVKTLRLFDQIDSVVDVTMAYVESEELVIKKTLEMSKSQKSSDNKNPYKDLSPQSKKLANTKDEYIDLPPSSKLVSNEFDVFFTGNYPLEVHLHIDRFHESSLPISDENLGNWLVERWALKERRLHRFYLPLDQWYSRLKPSSPLHAMLSTPKFKQHKQKNNSSIQQTYRESAIDNDDETYHRLSLHFAGKRINNRVSIDSSIDHRKLIRHELVGDDDMNTTDLSDEESTDIVEYPLPETFTRNYHLTKNTYTHYIVIIFMSIVMNILGGILCLYRPTIYLTICLVSSGFYIICFKLYGGIDGLEMEQFGFQVDEK